jgi:predicted transposase YbfD/YdcC
MKKTIKITEYFAEIETTEEHKGYYFSVGKALTIVILGTICGLRNVSQIHHWASNERVREFLSEHFSIKDIPCYYWLLCLLKLIRPESFNRCFIRWAQSFLSDKDQKLTLSFDGKTIRSTGKMDKYESPLHIVSAHVAELGITLGQQTVDGKSNEIPAMRELLGILDIKGCMVVADALNCQRDTAKAIVDGKADYLLNVKDNQPILKEEIEDYIRDEDVRKTMDTCTTEEKNSGRIEKRIAYATCDIDWLSDKKEDWVNLACIGAVNTQFTTKKGTSNEWHYYISSRKLSAKELLKHARLEWSVETMHWFLDVHFSEDFCRIEDRNVQQNLNMVRKMALNCIKDYKEKTGKTGPKHPISKIMLDCLVDCKNTLQILAHNEN